MISARPKYPPIHLLFVLLLLSSFALVAQGDIDAQNTLALTTQNLTVESVQIQTSNNSSSQGVNVAGGSSGPSSGGINAGNGRSNTTQTLLTTLTGEKC